MMETEARLRASLPPAVVATVRLEYVDDDLLVARCTEHEQTAPPAHWKYNRFPEEMRSNDEPAIFVLSRRRAGDAWAPERVESKKRGGAAELDAISENIRRLDRESLGGYREASSLGGE